MNAPVPSPSILDSAGVDPARAREILGDALAGADDGELFVERSESESFLFDDGRLKSAAYDATEGFGLRVVAGETAGYAHASEISEAAIRRAADSARLAKRGYAGTAAEAPRATNAKLYGEDNPLASPEFSDKVALLQEIDAWARARDPRIVQVMASIAGERRTVEILRADGRLIRDVRPLCRINVQVTVERDGRIRLLYRPNNLRSHRELVARTKRILRRLGFWLVVKHSHGSKNTTHQCGTLVFGTNPADSVLDPFCRAHDIDNLFVVDASFFPSSAAVNPGLTIIAQALRVADHIRSTELRHRSDVRESSVVQS